MPRRSDIDPLEIPRALLPGLFLVEVVSDDRRYVYRLVGTADVEAPSGGLASPQAYLDHFGSVRKALNWLVIRHRRIIWRDTDAGQHLLLGPRCGVWNSAEVMVPASGNSSERD